MDLTNLYVFRKKMLTVVFLLFVAVLSHAKLYNVAPEADLAYVRRQLLVMAQEYIHGVPSVGAFGADVCIPVTTGANNDGRQRAYAHARHLFRHHGIASVEYETYREYLQRGGGHGTYDDRFCMSMADLPHIGRILERGEL
jgi:hypothetical protein